LAISAVTAAAIVSPPACCRALWISPTQRCSIVGDAGIDQACRDPADRRPRRAAEQGAEWAAEQADHRAEGRAARRAPACAQVAPLLDMQLSGGIAPHDRRLVDADQSLLLCLYDLFQGIVRAILSGKGRHDQLKRCVRHAGLLSHWCSTGTRVQLPGTPERLGQGAPV
jgi:hypothetical protein